MWVQRFNQICIIFTVGYGLIAAITWLYWAYLPTPLPVAVHWSSYITAEGCGAKGDGVTDDSAAVNRCMEYPAPRVRVVFLAKTYAVRSTVYIGLK